MNSGVKIVLVLAFATFASCTEVNKCKSGVQLPVNVDVANCDKGPCDFIRGKEVIVNVTFDAPADIEDLTPEVVVLALGAEVNYPLPQKDGCKSLVDGVCPLEEGERTTYQLVMPILPIYPAIALDITFTLYSLDSGKKTPVTCFNIKAQVVVQ